MYRLAKIAVQGSKNELVFFLVFPCIDISLFGVKFRFFSLSQQCLNLKVLETFWWVRLLVFILAFSWDPSFCVFVGPWPDLCQNRVFIYP